jgi:hypothetical protein
MLSYDLKPEVINMNKLIKDSGVGLMRYKEWSEMDFDDAVIHGYPDISKELVAVTIHLPLWLRTEVSNINLEYNISQGRVYSTMVNYGCSLLKPMIDEPIKSMYDAYKVLGTSDNTVVMYLMQGSTISVNGVKGSNRKTLSVPTWTKNLMGNVASRLRMDFSSVVRLALYLAINRYDNILDHNKTVCQDELLKFSKALNDHMSVCVCLAEMIKSESDTIPVAEAEP